MENNIHALPGVILAAERGFVDSEIIECLEGLLAEARSGALKGISYAVLNVEDMIKVHWVGQYATANSTHGAIRLLEAYFTRARLEQMDRED